MTTPVIFTWEFPRTRHPQHACHKHLHLLTGLKLLTSTDQNVPNDHPCLLETLSSYPWSKSRLTSCMIFTFVNDADSIFLIKQHSYMNVNDYALWFPAQTQWKTRWKEIGWRAKNTSIVTWFTSSDLPPLIAYWFSWLWTVNFFFHRKVSMNQRLNSSW